jgi:succinate dehydrogenase / fumarate reductase, flavoprotein subunit
LAFYLEQGGGSRGARTVCSPGGDRVPQVRSGPLENLRFIPESGEDRNEQIHVRLDGTNFLCETRPIRSRNRDFHPFFERDWPDYLTGAIHDTSA